MRRVYWAGGLEPMATTKDELRKLLGRPSDDATWEDMQYSICVRERVERGRREAAEGKLVDEAEAEARIPQWLTE